MLECDLSAEVPVTEDGAMALGRQPDQRQADFWIATERLAPAPAHPFDQKLNQILRLSGFDPFCQAACQKFYAQKLGRPSIPPGVYFRMLLLGYFEKLDSEREIAWRCADSLALRAFLGYRVDEGTPDHSRLSRTRNRIESPRRPVFDWVLKRLTEQGLLKGQTLGIDASTLEADAALKSIVRRDTGQSYREFLAELTKASGIETPTAEELAKFDRQRKDKSASNDDWFNPNDPEAKITKMKDGRTHFAYQNEHAVDLDTGAIIAAEIHLANEGDTTTMWGTLEKAANSLQEVREDEQVVANCQANGVADPKSELHIQATVQDKGYHSAQTLVNLEELDIRGDIAEPDRGRQRWTARDPQEQELKRQAQQAVYRNRRRRRGAHSKHLPRRRGALVERAFEHVLDDGGMRRVWLKGRVKIAKRYLIHTAAFNLGLILRKLTG